MSIFDATTQFAATVVMNLNKNDASSLNWVNFSIRPPGTPCALGTQFLQRELTKIGDGSADYKVTVASLGPKSAPMCVWAVCILSESDKDEDDTRMDEDVDDDTDHAEVAVIRSLHAPSWFLSVNEIGVLDMIQVDVDAHGIDGMPKWSLRRTPHKRGEGSYNVVLSKDFGGGTELFLTDFSSPLTIDRGAAVEWEFDTVESVLVSATFVVFMCFHGTHPTVIMCCERA